MQKTEYVGQINEKVWFESYPAGVPHEINPDTYSSLSEFFEQKIRLYASEIAYINLGVQMTYQECEEHSRHFANFLLQHLLLKKGDRIGIMLPNVLQVPVAIFGVLRAGLVVVNINPLYTPAELQPILRDSGLETILVLSPFAHVIQEVILSTPIKNIIITEPMDLFPPMKKILASFYLNTIKRAIPHYSIPNAFSFQKALDFGKTVLFRPISINNNDIAFLQYTGGTTGIPKGAMLTHRNILANLEQALTWITPAISEKGEIFITALPLYHIFSLMANLFTPLAIGAKNILITNPRDTKRFIGEIAHTHFTMITGVNTLFASLIHHPDFKKNVDLSSLKLALAGGMALQKSVANEWEKITNKPLLEAYGLSETSPGISMMPVTIKKVIHGTVGLPLPSTEVEIRNKAKQALPPNEVGEIWVRGPQVMRGYWQDHVSTSHVLTHDGWFDTGDIGKMDEAGFLSIVDRKKDTIIISGFNVYPIEIEQVIEKHPDVQEVAVVGISGKEGQEIIKAYIIRQDITLTRNEIIEHCKKYLTAYKIPKIIEFVESLPKSNVGKVLKRKLR